MIKFTLEGLPVSSNQAWFNIGHSGRGLSTAAKKYKNEVQVFIGRTYPTELTQFHKNEPHLIMFRVHVAELQNTTWGKKKGAESRYKKNDATNRIKLLEDILATVTGVDDSATMTFIVDKVQTQEPGREFVEVFIWNTFREETPFDEPLAGL